MYEQWHPLGVVGIISAFNFPVAVWAWNCLPGRHLRQRLGVEALAQDPAHGDRRPAHLQQGDARGQTTGDLPAVHRWRHRAGDPLRRRPARRTGVVHRLHRHRPQRGRARGAPARQGAAGARRQQRHHRRRIRRPETRGALHRVRRRGHRGAAVHDHATSAGTSLQAGRAGEEAHSRVFAGEDRQSQRPGDAHGSADRQVRGGALLAGHRAGQGRRRHRDHRREGARGQGQFRRADYCPGAKTTGPSCSTRPLRPCCT